MQLPQTNVSASVLQPRRRLNADETFMWELAHFLEGHTPAWLARPTWNDPPYEIGHFLTRIGRHDESKPDPKSRRKPVSPRVNVDSAGWISVRELLKHDRDRELNPRGPHIISATAFLQAFLTDKKGRVLLSFPHYVDVVGQHEDEFWIHA